MRLTQENTNRPTHTNRTFPGVQSPHRLTIGLFALVTSILSLTVANEHANGQDLVRKATPPTYSVCARSCSRSRWEAKGYNDLNSAVRAASALRHDNNRVFIIKGRSPEELGEFPVHPRYGNNDEPTPTSCSVYNLKIVNRCEIACSLKATTTQVQDAMLLANGMRERDQLTEVVYHFPAAQKRNGR